MSSNSPSPFPTHQGGRRADDAPLRSIAAHTPGLVYQFLTSALALEKPPVVYQQVVAVKKGDETKPWAKDLAAAFKSPFFKQVLTKEFPGYTYPAGL